MNHGRLEGLITIPTGGITGAFTCTDDGGGPTAVDLTAGTYYWTLQDSGANTFAEQLQADICNAMASNWVVEISSNETGTGKVTISNDDAVAEVAWADTDIRDLLGFGSDGNLSGSTSYMSSDHAKAIWLPDGPPVSPFGLDDEGADEPDQVHSESGAGHVLTLGYQRKTAQWVRWIGLSRAKTRIAGEAVTGESLQQFERDVIWAEATYCPARKLRISPNADALAGSVYRSSAQITYQQMQENYLGLWRVEFPRIVLVP
jgi:hypothetical protein